jgi:nicotinamidase-related amidase
MRHPQILQADRSILVVVDMQEPFLRHIFERERVLQNCRLLIQAANILKVPVVATLQYAQKMGGVVPEIAEVLPQGCEPIDKMCFSCYGSEPFRAALMASERTQVVVCGVESHICVMQTALDALGAGFQVQVPEDAVSSRSRGELANRHAPAAPCGGSGNLYGVGHLRVAGSGGHRRVPADTAAGEVKQKPLPVAAGA